MSEKCIKIVPSITNYPDREQKAKIILDWLFQIDAVKSVKDDCILSKNYGYPISNGAKELTDYPGHLPFSLRTNGLDISMGNEIFFADGLDSFICPICKMNVAEENLDFDNFVTNGDPRLACPGCQKKSDLNDYITEPVWGFSNLGFTFWNWPPFKDDVVKKFAYLLGCKVKIVFSRI